MRRIVIIMTMKDNRYFERPRQICRRCGMLLNNNNIRTILANVPCQYEGTSRAHAWLSYDPRAIALIPNIGKGEVVLHGMVGNFVRMHTDGRITLWTSDKPTDPLAADAHSIYQEISPEGFAWVTPWGKMSLDANGFHVVTRGGARFDLGGISGLPGPFGALSSYAAVSAGTVTVEGSSVALGPPAGVAQPVPQGTALGLLIDTMLAAITAAGAGANAAAVAPLITLAKTLAATVNSSATTTT
jgi:hypothetical protein